MVNNYSNEALKEMIDNRIDELIPLENKEYSNLCEAMRYSIIDAGKRIRPILFLQTYILLGGVPTDVLNFACAIEMIHSYSLIHDDLPCMDDDEIRRGKPSCHIKFGESTALLAGDALLTLAFKTATDCNNVENANLIKAITKIADRSGVDGMIGGQVIDLKYENCNPSLDIIKRMYSLKTGALIKLSVESAAILADATQQQLYKLVDFAENLGLAFQIVDDILDITSSTEVLGKPVGSDKANNKSTYVSFYGLEASKNYVDTLTDNSINALSQFSNNADLIQFAELLRNRIF